MKNVRQFGVPVVIAINRFHADTDAELKMVNDYAAGLGASVVLCEVFAKGGEGGEALAKEVIAMLAARNGAYKPLYDANAADQAEDRHDREECVWRRLAPITRLRRIVRSST